MVDNWYYSIMLILLEIVLRLVSMGNWLSFRELMEIILYSIYHHMYKIYTIKLQQQLQPIQLQAQAHWHRI